MNNKNTIKIYGQEFGRWRVVQGSLIYSVFLLFSVLSFAEGDIKLLYFYLIACLAIYAVFLWLSYSKQRVLNKQVIVIAAMKSLCFPSFTTG